MQPRNRISHCVLCKKNGEPRGFYESHTLRDTNNAVICPILLQFICPHCGQKGKHTANYCDLLKNLRQQKLDLTTRRS